MTDSKILPIPSRLLDSLKEYHSPKKQLLSAQSKVAYTAAVYYYRLRRHIKNYFGRRASQHTEHEYLPSVVARHQSLLLKKLGDSNEHLQRQKIKNLALAIERINKAIIEPQQTFSYWHLIGKPKAKDGYVLGMLLSRGKVVEGVGGGLCQLSNLLYWLFLHAPVEIIERYHHSYDVFPDSGRVLPFGSGATVFYNYVDLVVKNISPQPLQLKLWLTDAHLKGQILTPHSFPLKYSIREMNHCFVNWKGKLFRYNELWQDIFKEGKLQETRFITKNFAPVLYKAIPGDLAKKGYKVLEI